MPEIPYALPGFNKLNFQAPQFPGAPEGFPTSFNQGYSLSYQGGDKDRLMGEDAYQYGDFPEWMQRRAPVGQLRKMQGQLPGLFDTQGIQDAWSNLSGQQMSSAKASAGAAARSAENRAMLSGGRVGAGFAAASALLPHFRQQAQQQLDLEGLKAQIRGNQAQLGAQLASGIAGLQDARMGRQTNYAIEAARQGQKRIGFQGNQGVGVGNRGGQLDYSQGGFGSGDQSATPGYVSNAGGVQYGSINGRQVPGHVFSPGALAAMGYRM